jgi:hypothetical protein
MLRTLIKIWIVTSLAKAAITPLVPHTKNDLGPWRIRAITLFPEEARRFHSKKAGR